MVCKYVLISVRGYVKINTIRGRLCCPFADSGQAVADTRGNVSYASIGGAGRR